MCECGLGGGGGGGIEVGSCRTNQNGAATGLLEVATVPTVLSEFREVLHNESSNEVLRQALRKCVRIFARTLCSAHFRSLHASSARTT